MLSVDYCNQIAWAQFLKFYSRFLYKKVVIDIIWLLLSGSIASKLITVKGFHCICKKRSKFANLLIRSRLRKHCSKILSMFRTAEPCVTIITDAYPGIIIQFIQLARCRPLAHQHLLLLWTPLISAELLVSKKQFYHT
jgi:hypothetical protein